MTVFKPGEGMCHAVVCPGPHYLHEFNCSNKAKAEKDGRPVCGTHLRAKHVRLVLLQAVPSQGSDRD